VLHAINEIIPKVASAYLFIELSLRIKSKANRKYKW
jgi:hypothetical protein